MFKTISNNGDSMENVFNVCDFGAVGDGIFDSTDAFQSAIDEAEKVKGAVIVPPGSYSCKSITMKPSVSLQGFSGWGYRENGGSVIRLSDENAHCLIDMSGAFGARLRDLQLIGCGLGESVHGVYVWWEDQKSRLSDPSEREGNVYPEKTQIGFREDSVIIENCNIKNFSGDAVHLERIWAFTVKDCMLIANKGNGIYIKGWDGWISDCIMHSNRGAGIFADDICAAVTITGNRIEWNRNGGINLVNSSLLNVTGNYFDRAYGPAVKLVGGWIICNNITFTGNIFNRSGRYEEDYLRDNSCHLYLENCNNMAITGNTFLVGKDDFGEEGGGTTPDYGIIYKKLNSCVISGNTMYNGANKKSLLDLGEHTGESCISNNTGEI